MKAIEGSSVSGLSRVDFSVDQTIYILTHAPLKIIDERLCICVQGFWYRLCRTDLLDDVCTFSYLQGSLEEMRQLYIRKVQYGARIGKSTRRFAIIDSATDG